MRLDVFAYLLMILGPLIHFRRSFFGIVVHRERTNFGIFESWIIMVHLGKAISWKNAKVDQTPQNLNVHGVRCFSFHQHKAKVKRTSNVSAKWISYSGRTIVTNSALRNKIERFIELQKKSGDLLQSWPFSPNPSKWNCQGGPHFENSNFGCSSAGPTHHRSEAGVPQVRSCPPRGGLVQGGGIGIFGYCL